VTRFPVGVRKPVKVRIYRRRDHYLLQWWEPTRGRTCYDRIDGDLLDAIATARQIDDRLASSGRSGAASNLVPPEQLVERYLADLTARADAGTLALRSVSRFRAALDHYLAFIRDAGIDARCRRSIAAADRKLALSLSAWLAARCVTPNGRSSGSTSSAGHPMSKPDFVLDVVRAAYAWAADPQRGDLLPAGFSSPFRRCVIGRSRVAPRNLLGEPEITNDMAVKLVEACDDYQLRLMTPMLLWGCRPGELGWILRERTDAAYLRVACLPELDFVTKGIRDKSLPMIDVAREILVPAGSSPTGLLFLRRDVLIGSVRPLLLDASYEQLVAEYRSRIAAQRASTAVERIRIRDRLMYDAGAVRYDDVEREFAELKRRLGWPRAATLKDLRHLAQTNLDNGGLSREARQYILGQAPDQAAIGHYVHLNQLGGQYAAAACKGMSKLQSALSDWKNPHPHGARQ
jgi:hypothetical protein